MYSIDTVSSSCDIKSLFRIIRDDVFYKAIVYWIEKLINEISFLSRKFAKGFILEGLSIILILTIIFTTKSKELL